ncbi:MAG: putative metallocarboxypeptidase ecm14 [Peltula sp. TS41687]|nr:MAG: putative metallocarboxypeptidase ecm14 [Peltula sp. TS41687]
MHQLGRMGPLVLLLLLHLALPSSINLVAAGSVFDRSLSLPFQFPSALRGEPNEISGFWVLFRDLFVRSVFGLPKANDRQGGTLLPSTEKMQASRNGSPSNLLARYGGDLVLRFEINDADEAKALAEASNILFLDVWESREDWVDIRISKEVIPSLLGLLPPTMQRSHKPVIQDLAQAVFNSYPTSESVHFSAPPAQGRSTLAPVHTSGRPVENLFFRDYQPLSVIVPWMRLLASLYPSHVRMISVGTSYEGRDILALRVGVHPTNSQKPLSPRKTIVIAGGTHAREWISTSTVNYISYGLVTAFGKSPWSTKLLEEFDWVFIPTLNPDGYVYTWDRDRLWRKNRQETTVGFCKGVDLDRNWESHWDGVTAKGNPCSESYPGEEPFEAVESRTFAQWAKNETQNNNVELVGFMDFHSYSQQVLYPFSYSCAASPPNLENLKELALGIAKAFRSSSGEHYAVVSACEGGVTRSPGGKKILHPRMETGGGSALDWFSQEMQVPYAYQLKLRDTGSYGFLLPKENIIPTGEEALAAVNYFGRFILKSIDDVSPQAGGPLDASGAVKGVQSTSDKETLGDLDNDAPPSRSLAENEVDGNWELRRRRRR